MTKLKAAFAFSTILLASSGAFAASTSYPRQISNCGQELTFKGRAEDRCGSRPVNDGNALCSRPRRQGRWHVRLVQ